MRANWLAEPLVCGGSDPVLFNGSPDRRLRDRAVDRLMPLLRKTGCDSNWARHPASSVCPLCGPYSWPEHAHEMALWGRAKGLPDKPHHE